VLALLNEESNLPSATQIVVADVALASFDELLGGGSEIVQ
jgi:hypothetical protein